MMQSDDAYAGSESFYRLADAVEEIFGYQYLLPSHQGRAAEHLLAKTFVKPGHIVPMNYHFTTTKAHFNLAGRQGAGAIRRRRRSTRKARARSRGTWISAGCKAAIDEAGPENVSFVRMEATTNLIGGQPFSLDNLRAGEGADRAAGHFPGGGRQPDFRERLLHPPARAGLRERFHPRHRPRNHGRGRPLLPLRPQELHGARRPDRHQPQGSSRGHPPLAAGLRGLLTPTAACPRRRSKPWPWACGK